MRWWGRQYCGRWYLSAEAYTAKVLVLKVDSGVASLAVRVVELIPTSVPRSF